MELPGGLDSSMLARAALRDGLVLAPGLVFGDGKTLSHWMRFNAAHCDRPDLWPRLGRLLEDQDREKKLRH